MTTIRDLKKQLKVCIDYSNKLSCALQKLSIQASDLLGYEVDAQMCNGEEIEFRKVDDNGYVDAFSTIREEEIIKGGNNE